MTRPADLGTFVVSLMPRHLFCFIALALDLVAYVGVLRMVYLILFPLYVPRSPRGKWQMYYDHVPAL